jgi:hypothetical protein
MIETKKKEEKQIIKTYFDVKIETLLPATLMYKVLAENAEQALILIKNIQPNSVKYKLVGRRDIKLMIYDAGTCIIRLVKNIIK